MKKLHLFIWSFLLLGLPLSAIDMYVDPILYQTDKAAYLEVNLFFLGESLVSVTSPESVFYEPSIEVLILIKNKRGEIESYEKYLLTGPKHLQALNLVDRKRFLLKDGNYTLEVKAHEIAQANNKATFTFPFEVQFQSDKLHIASLQLLGDFYKDTLQSPMAKQGYYTESLPFDFSPKAQKILSFYTEIYNSHQLVKNNFNIHYKINMTYQNGKSKTFIEETISKKAQAIIPLFLRTDISKLPSGNYELIVEVADTEDQIIASTNKRFQKSNPEVARQILYQELDVDNAFTQDMDSSDVVYALKAIIPIVRPQDKENYNYTIKHAGVAVQKQLLYNFWVSQHAQRPKDMYDAYMKVARIVDKQYFSGLGRGFESDRGYVFLKYGKPNDIIQVENEPSAPPYEIWFYNDFPSTSQTNVRFLFYNPTLSIGQYELLHSTAIGELNNEQWEIMLYKDDNGAMEETDINSTRVRDGLARRAREYFGEFK